MNCTRLHVFNQVDDATLIPSSENAQFPVSNLKDYRRTKVFRSLTNDDSVVFDFGETVPVNSFMVVANPKFGWGMTQLTIELNGSNSWGAPVVSEVVALDPIYGVGYFEWPSDQNYRYARVVMQNVSGYCELSKVFIGKYQDLGEIDFNYPLDYKNDSNATLSKNRYGQRFVDKINNQRLLSGDLANMTKDEAESVLEALDYCGEVRPIWVRLEQSNITVNPNRLNGCYFLRSIPTAKFNAGSYWSIPLDFEEAT